MTIDAREDLIKNPKQKNSFVQKERKEFSSKPAILLTGQIHSREVITSSMVLFSALKMLHGGLVHKDKTYENLLAQNKYYCIPSINVDGVNFIEDKYKEDGVLLPKRTNMHFRLNVVEKDYKTDKLNMTQFNKTQNASEQCGDAINAGVDLNRNFAYKFGYGSSNGKECTGEDYRGPAPFSEPETKAVRDFLKKRKDEIKFVYNFHCAGNLFILPYNGELPNSLYQQNPEIK